VVLKKSLLILKSNPMIIVLFVLAIVLLAVPAMLVLPDTNRLMAISGEISRNLTSSSGVDILITEMLFSILKLLLYSLAVCGFGIVFIAGLGNMLAAAVNGGKASIKIFRFGIKKFFIKTLLSFLLLVAVIYGFSIIISIISIPFALMGVMNNAFDPDAIAGNQRMVSIVSSGLMIFLYPLILLWFPSIFLNRNDGVLACFKKGFKAGIKKYFVLVAVTVVTLLPTILLYIFTKNIYSILESPSYILMYAYQAIIMPFLLIYLFELYNEIRENQLNLKANNI